jgi:hypothetical protein
MVMVQRMAFLSMIGNRACPARRRTACLEEEEVVVVELSLEAPVARQEKRVLAW